MIFKRFVEKTCRSPHGSYGNRCNTSRCSVDASPVHASTDAHALSFLPTTHVYRREREVTGVSMKAFAGEICILFFLLYNKPSCGNVGSKYSTDISKKQTRVPLCFTPLQKPHSNTHFTAPRSSHHDISGAKNRPSRAHRALSLIGRAVKKRRVLFLLEGLDAGDGAAEDQRVDVSGALVGVHSLEVH